MRTKPYAIHTCQFCNIHFVTFLQGKPTTCEAEDCQEKKRERLTAIRIKSAKKNHARRKQEKINDRTYQPGRPSIDWEELVIGYNRIYGTKYENHIEMIPHLYSQMGAHPMETLLGVTHSTILKKLRQLGVKIRPRGGPNNTGKYRGGWIHRVQS